MKNNKTRYWRVAGALLVPLFITACEEAGDFPDQETACTFDGNREAARAASAAAFPAPVVDTLLVNGTVAWTSSNPTAVPTSSRVMSSPCGVPASARGPIPTSRRS